MAFFRRKRKGTIEKNVKVSDIYVVASMIISNHNDGSGAGPMCVTMYFLAKCEAGDYYELFSGKKLEMENQSEYDFRSRTFNTPYVEKAEPLTKYLINHKKLMIDIQSLFDFITRMNVLDKLGAFSEEDDDEVL